MRKQLFLYLFILTALFTVFTYKYYDAALKTEQKKYETTRKILKDSIALVSDKLYDADYFALENKDNSQDYLEKYDVNILLPKIKNALLAYNDDKNGNKYTGLEKLNEQKFIMNKIKVLNHRWIIAEYNDGKNWGDVLLKYFINEDETIDFVVIETFLYPQQKY
ncbi:MAG: hypothetical protein ACI9XR_000849 [Flavobacterium sp.]|jgi:hypothetical protein